MDELAEVAVLDGGRSVSSPAFAPPPGAVIRFSTDVVEPPQRVAYWQDVMARTLIGCRSSMLDGDDFAVDFQLAAGRTARLARGRMRGVRTVRDAACLSDQDDSLLFTLVLRGSATADHNGHRVRLGPGAGVLTTLSGYCDTRWPAADVLAIRTDRAALRGLDPARACGVARQADAPAMALLRAYAATARKAALRGEALTPLAERQLAELVATACLHGHGDGEVLDAARVARMPEAMAAQHANPCLSMRHVAAAVGLSERSGHLLFERAGLRFTKELHALRLDRARELLLVGDARVLDVALAVGFSDLSHFYRLFRRRFGATPGDLRDAAAGREAMPA